MGSGEAVVADFKHKPYTIPAHLWASNLTLYCGSHCLRVVAVRVVQSLILTRSLRSGQAESRVQQAVYAVGPPVHPCGFVENRSIQVSIQSHYKEGARIGRTLFGQRVLSRFYANYVSGKPKLD